MNHSTEAKKILYVINQLGIGGAERQLLYLVRNLDRTQFSPLVCVLTTSTELATEFRSAGIPVVVFRRLSPKFDLSKLLRLIILLRKVKPDLVHSFMTTANIYASLAGRFVHTRVIVSERNAEPNKPALRRWMECVSIRRAACLIANSQAGASRIIRRGVMPKEKVFVIHNGIDLTRFEALPDSITVRIKFGLCSDIPIVGIVGTIDGERKDHLTFFQAMHVLDQQYGQQVQILCVGTGPMLQQVRDLVHKLGLEERTVFTGIREDVPEIMRGLDVLVSSSRWEGMPNVIMEAMAAGRPVVATAVGGTPELVKHGETGFLVPPGNPSALAAAVLRVLEHPNLAFQMGQAGRRRIEQYFTVEKMVRSTEAIYQYLFSQSG